MSDRRRWLRRLGPAMLLAVLAVAWLVPGPDWLRLATPDRRPAERMDATIDGLPDAVRVLVGFDPDLGTYAEIRPTVRALLAELQARDARLAVVSLTPEGRALAVAELARLERSGEGAVDDLGFAAGAEAGLVDLADGLTERHDAIVVVGGNDIGPRSWVEQVRPRADVPILAVTPVVLLPEVQPYVAGGQLAAALTTPRDGAAWRAGLAPGAANAADEPRALAVLVGLLVAVAVLARGVGGRAIGAIRGMRIGPTA
jgi:hypothetical protein